MKALPTCDSFSFPLISDEEFQDAVLGFMKGDLRKRPSLSISFAVEDAVAV
jgi:hypothetical protein